MFLHCIRPDRPMELINRKAETVASAIVSRLLPTAVRLDGRTYVVKNRLIAVEDDVTIVDVEPTTKAPAE